MSSNPLPLSRRDFLAASAAAAVYATTAGAQDPVPDELIGPLVGHTDTSSTILWARFNRPGKYPITIRPANGGIARTFTADTTERMDFTARWSIDGLSPATKYVVDLAGGRPCSFTTPPANDAKTKVTLALGSCAKEDAACRAVWTRMVAENVDAVLLGGDTPYIDSTNLVKQRSRHREFASVSEYQMLLSTRPFWSTWDDHDFGVNDCDGTIKGKENSRRAFTEYRAQPKFGDGKEGVYTSFRWGPIEVFVLDARWWSYTGPSFADPTKKTLLGEGQWKWLQASLKKSNAPFKLIVAGMIWEDKKNSEKDDWETYAHERVALFDFIKKEKIGGVSLFGGDIHVTRLLKYPAEHVGYPMQAFISSPMHGSVIPSLNVPHPYLVDSKVQKNTFMTLTADTTVTPPTLTARFLDTAGNSLFADTTLKADELVQT